MRRFLRCHDPVPYSVLLHVAPLAISFRSPPCRQMRGGSSRPWRHAIGRRTDAACASHRPEITQTYARLLAAPAIRKLLDDIHADDARTLAEHRRLTEIEAPPFAEKARADVMCSVSVRSAWRTPPSTPMETSSVCGKAWAAALCSSCRRTSTQSSPPALTSASRSAKGASDSPASPTTRGGSRCCSRG